MRGTRSILLIGLLAAACGREPAAIICNNANCVPPIDVNRDNTMEALRQSLALEWHNRPAFDGMEIDTVWDSAGDRCVFTYDYDTAEGAFDAHQAADEIAAHLRATAAGAGRRRFYFKMQNKVPVAPDGDAPTVAELAAHMDCAIDLAEIVESAASEVGRPLTVIFGEDPAQLAALVRRPRWIAAADTGLDRRLLLTLDEAPVGGTGVDVVSIEATNLRAEEYAAIREIQDRGLDVQLWSRYLSVEIMDALDTIEPTLYDTNDVLSARLYLGPTPEEP